MAESIFEVKTPMFQGPLELLLDLIEKRKLHISDISLSKVTDDYIAYIKQYEDSPWRIGERANFILVASTLLLIKSKSLLPNLALSEEEQYSIYDLERRLMIYKEIRDLSIYVRERFGKKVIFLRSENKMINPVFCKKVIFLRSENKMINPVFSPHESMNVGNLLSAVSVIIKNFPKAEIITKAFVNKVISLEEMIVNLTKRIQSSLKISFREFSRFGKVEKVNVIVGFLAMLELVKQGIVKVSQDSHFADIQIETEKVGTPTYGD